jgi:hypothetical protein
VSSRALIHQRNDISPQNHLFISFPTCRVDHQAPSDRTNLKATFDGFRSLALAFYRQVHLIFVDYFFANQFRSAFKRLGCFISQWKHCSGGCGRVQFLVDLQSSLIFIERQTPKTCHVEHYFGNRIVRHIEIIKA